MAEVTYADLKFMTREQPRNQEPHEAKAKDSPTPSPYWRPAAVILGIFCFGLLGFIIRSAQSYSSYSFWIALSRKGADGSWLWEDGTAFSTDL
ncbi:C-type lectin domain family 7 member A-like [Emys orbicularis]|uniref:C-type lectin domain family 7 member A-like n=1 Tax=Emys orbicularis TaxID=82168 RepID=UPI0031FCF6BA